MYIKKKNESPIVLSIARTMNVVTRCSKRLTSSVTSPSLRDWQELAFVFPEPVYKIL